MENNKNGHLGESLRKKLENFPEEFPSENNWQHVRSRMLSEGLLRKKSSTRKRYLFLLIMLLITGTAVLISVPFLNKKENAIVQNTLQQKEVKATEKNEMKENKINPETESVKNGNEKIVSPAKIAAAKPESEIKNYVAPSPSNNTKQKNDKTSEKTHQETAKEIAAQLTDASGESEKWEAENNTSVSSDGAMGEIKITKREKPAETSSQVASEAIPASATDSALVKNSSEAASIVNDTSSAAHPITEKQDSVQTEVTAATKTEPENNSSGKIRLGVFISWDSNQYFLKESDNAEQAHADYIINSDSISGEKSSAQFTVGIRASYFISKKTAIETGVYYSQKKKVDAAIYTPVYSSTSGETVSDYVYHFNAKYFEVDGKLKYYVHHQKPAVYISAGAKGSFNLSQDGPDYYEHTVYSESAIPRTERVSLKPASLGLSLILAAGAEIPLSPRCNFFLEPSYTYALDPVINNPDYIIVPVNHFRRSISIGTGLNYTF